MHTNDVNEIKRSSHVLHSSIKIQNQILCAKDEIKGLRQNVLD